VLNRRRTTTGLVAATVLAASLVVTAAPANAGGDAGTMVSSTNSERSKRGVPTLKVSSELNRIAQRWAATMASDGDLRHNPRLQQQAAPFRWVGENVGVGPDAASIHRALMNSPAHRANILDRDYTQIGVGAVRDSRGALWIAEVFRRPLSTGTTTSKPKPATKPRPAATSKPRVVTAQSRGDASPAAKRAPVRAPAAKARPAPPPPPPPPTLSQRVATARSMAATVAGSDPVASTLRFSAAMSALAD
jgi:hypothetical protein